MIYWHIYTNVYKGYASRIYIYIYIYIYISSNTYNTELNNNDVPSCTRLRRYNSFFFFFHLLIHLLEYVFFRIFPFSSLFTVSFSDDNAIGESRNMFARGGRHQIYMIKKPSID